MTTFAVPPAGSPAWRRHYPTPPDVKLNIPAGTWCPIDDTTLQNRPDGWSCPTCKAAWNFHGLAGRWLDEPTVRWRPSAVLVLAGLAGCAAAAAALVAVLGELDQRLLWWLSAAIAAAAVLYVAAGWLSRQIADWPYRHNRVIGPVDRDGEVSDER